MNLLIISNGNGLSDVKSGGVTRNIQLIKNKPAEWNVTVCCTSGLKKLYLKENLDCVFVVNKCSFAKKIESNVFDRFFSYILSTIYSFLNIRKIKNIDLVLSPSDYIFDVFPALICKLRQQRIKFICTLHHICDNPFKRRGNFLINAISYFMQRASYLLVAKFADGIVVYDTEVGKKIVNKLRAFGYKGFIHYTFNGVDLERIASIQPNEKIWEATFAGGLRVTKGVYDLVPIWRIVVNRLPMARLLIMGHGSKDVECNLRKELIANELQENIILAGEVEFDTMIYNMKSSQLFISTSHEEGWGISVCEAIACKIEVLVYDLEVFKVFGENLKKIPFGNHQAYANAIIESLLDKCGRPLINNEIDKYKWEDIASSEYRYYESLN